MFSRFVSFIFLLSIFFHAVGGVPNIDVQPTFFIFATFFITVFCFKLKFDLKDLILLFTCLFSIVLAYIFQHDYLTIKYILTYIVCIFTAWYIIVLIKNDYLKDVTPKLIYTFICIYVLVGVVQFFKPDFLSFLVTRSEDAALSFANSGRGVRSLTGEPAHLGKIFSLLNILLIYLYVCRENTLKFKQQAIIVTISLFLINMFVSRSAYAILFHFCVLSFLLFFLYRKFFYIFVVSLVVSGVAFISILFNMETDIRFVKLFIAVFNNPDFIMAQGAVKRLFNIPMILNNITYFDWYGAGVNPKSPITSILTPFGKFEYVVKHRGYGGYFEYILKFGILSLPILFPYFYALNIIRKIVIRIKGKPYYLGYFFAITIFVFTVQDGTPVNPLPLFLLIYVYLNTKKLIKKRDYVQGP
jgi:hypothetical protein